MIEFAVRKSREAICKLPDTVIISGTYTIGKEKVFLALAEALDSKICVTKEKERILGCLQWPALQSLLTTAPLTARVHVLPMKKLNVNVCVFSHFILMLHAMCTISCRICRYIWSHCSLFSPACLHSYPLAGRTTILEQVSPHFDPEQLDLCLCTVSQCMVLCNSPFFYCNDTGIPYSEHSSFTELRQFVQSLTPQRVVPTVGNQSTPKRNEMMNYLEQWRKGPTSTLPHARQMKIDSIL